MASLALMAMAMVMMMVTDLALNFLFDLAVLHGQKIVLGDLYNTNN